MQSLEQEDRDKLQSAAGKVSRYATIGSLLGLGLGVALAFRIRRNRLAYFNAFRAIERPEAVVFPGGRTGTLLYLTLPHLTLPSLHYLPTHLPTTLPNPSQLSEY